MTTPLWCLLAVAALPYVLAGVGGYFRVKQCGTIDNHSPRQQYAQLEGVGARAFAAQQNAWEALGLFTATVAIAHFAAADAERTASAAMFFVGTRLLHPICYLANWATLRSIVAIAGLASCIYIWTLAGRA